MSAAPLIGPVMEQREAELNELNIKERWSTFPEYFSYLQNKGIAVNFATLVGHGNLRASVAGYSDRALSEDEMKTSVSRLRDAMKAGAKGLSTGLIYPPGIYSGAPELIRLASVAVKYQGIYTTHMRSEGDGLLESVDEVIKIAEKSGIHAHISHLKTSGENNWKKIGVVIEKVDRAIESGLMLTCDRYPYTASSTDLDAVLPSWAFKGGRKEEIERLKRDKARIKEDMLKDHPETAEMSFWEKVAVSSLSLNKNKWMEGRNLAEISNAVNKSPFSLLFDLLIEEDLAVGAVFFFMNEDNLILILKQPYTMIGTDSAARSFDGITAKGKPHPRGFGSFPRILGEYVKKNGVLSLSEAIFKMTGFPAMTFKLDRRGVIKKGFYADITVFDPEKIKGRADYNKPYQRPDGMYHVFVNGTPVLVNGELTGALPGRILK